MIYPPYLAVATVRNEEEHLSTCLDSLLNQSHPPSDIVVVDGNSTDDTQSILSNYPDQIRVQIDTRPRHFVWSFNILRSIRIAIEAVEIKDPEWKFLYIFDGDIKLHDRLYIEKLLKKMIKYPKLGITGGNIKGRNVWRDHPGNGARIYRRECWDDIDGFSTILHWDSQVLLKAMQHNWKVMCFSDPEYTELRPSWNDTAYKWYLEGVGRYILGYPLAHTILAAIRHIKRSRAIGSMIMALSHIIMAVTRIGRIDDPE